MQPQVVTYPGIRLVKEFPPFPKNPFGLMRGSFIYTDSEELADEFGFTAGQPIPLCYDGHHVRSLTIELTIDGLVALINKGVWKVSDREPMPEESFVNLEFRMGGGQITVADFWMRLWDTQQEVPEYFKLQTAPDVSSFDLKGAAAAAGKQLIVHAEVSPSQITQNGAGGQSISTVVGNADKGLLDCEVPLSLDDMLSGDRFFLCELFGD